ncbi:MAG: arsenic efflux protein [Bacteroidales bacterium]|nr:arsenic efflux protein [Bacteroidales bacterium]
MGHLLIDILRNSILITGLVVVMMMMIESLNIESKGLVFNGLRKTKFGQVIVAALLGSVPGCMGGFAAVSLYTHRMFSFGALVAMMIASSGDEAFVMLAMIPEQALVIFAVLFVIAVAAGVIVDKIWEQKHEETNCSDGYTIHNHEVSDESHDDFQSNGTHKGAKRTYGWRRIVMFAGLAIFIAALATGQLGHDHSVHTHEHSGHIHEAECQDEHCHHQDEICAADCDHTKTGDITKSAGFSVNLLNEDWMNVLFAGLSVIMLFVLLLGSDHFVEEHLWNHIIKKHLPTIFVWTFGVLLVVGIGLQYIAIDHWISDNTVLMILLATLIGIIPESGPHMIFVTLYAAGVVPFPVLLASCISQDGHSSIPLLAESKKSFAWAKLINCIVALAAGFGAMLIM